MDLQSLVLITKLAKQYHTMMSSVTLPPEKLGRNDFEVIVVIGIVEPLLFLCLLSLFKYLFCNILFLIILMFFYFGFTFI